MPSRARGKTDRKKEYSPPRFAVLTPDQAKSRLTEGALPGDVAAEQLGTAASLLGRSGTDERSIPGRAERAPPGK